ncbi:MAG: protein phosphatase 2C domain-containing protein [Terracidiphilus sp.]|jgi:serine/threonine protein phosphatase PrpC
MSDTPVLGQPVILFAEECDRGTLRQVNHDSLLHVRIALGDLLVVADGVGGENTGVVSAAQMAVQLIQSHLAALPEDYPAEKAIHDAIEQANAKITPVDKDHEVPQLRVGTAVVVALVQQIAEGAQAWIGHVGDCRAYLLRAGHLDRLTSDHSGVQSLLNRSLITPEEAYRHPDTSILTRSLGVGPEVEVDIEGHALATGDTLLLCSDGLWDTLSDKVIEATASGPTVEAAVHGLLMRALEAGGRDNISIEMARIIETRSLPGKNTQTGLLKWLVVIFLLGLVGLGVLSYLTFWANN